jgi:hypothetical protein
MKLRYYVLLIGLVVFSPLQAGSVEWALKDLQGVQETADAAFADGEYKKARKLYYQLSYLGNKYAQYKLSVMYMLGYGVDQDWPQAYAWATTAAEHGQDSLIKHKEAVWEQIPKAQRAAAGAEAEKNFEKYNDLNIAKVLWVKARQKDLKSIGRGHLNDSMVAVQAACDDPSTQISGGNSTAGSLPAGGEVATGGTVSYGDVCSGFTNNRGRDPALTMLLLESIERMMKTRYEGGIVELGDFEVIDEDIVDESEAEEKD